MSRAAVAVSNALECAKALERALEALYPSLDVYEGVLLLIAEFVPYSEYPARALLVMLL